MDDNDGRGIVTRGLHVVGVGHAHAPKADAADLRAFGAECCGSRAVHPPGWLAAYTAGVAFAILTPESEWPQRRSLERILSTVPGDLHW